MIAETHSSMKRYFIILLTLVALKLLSYTIKSSLPRHEIQAFITNEKLRLEAEVNENSNGIKNLLQVNKAQITPDIFPGEGENTFFSKFYFPDMHHYLIYLIQNNPEAKLDTIENINSFPEELHAEIMEMKAIDQIFDLMKSKNVGNSPYHPISLIPLIHSINEKDGQLDISLEPIMYPEVSQIPGIQIFLQPTNERVNHNPFKYNREKHNVKVIMLNPVTNEENVLTYD